MTMKDWCRSLQPIQLYVVIVLTVVFLLAEMVVSHTTHALVLLVDAYHMMCNIVSLMGCLVNIKRTPDSSAPCQLEEICDVTPCSSEDGACTSTSPCDMHARVDRQPCSSERRLKNTFGWARIDVVMMLSGGVVLASLCFSVVVEALQTLVHIGHQHQMHQPILVMTLGAVGLLLNGLCYLLIGGYTFHQSSFLQVTPSGDVVLDKVTASGEKDASKPPTSIRAALPGSFSKRQEAREVAMDITGCVLVMVCSLVVYFTDECVAKYVDPALAILSSVILVLLSCPYMKESGLILLQTMPDTINIDSLRGELLKAFPAVVNVHDLHVWRLTASKVYTTVHVVFLSTKDYSQITKDITEFFREHGITHITIQPEFYKLSNNSIMAPMPSERDVLCLVKCKADWCHAQHCCANISDDPDKVIVSSLGHGHSHSHGGHGHSHGHKGLKKHKNDSRDMKKLEILHPMSLKTLESSVDKQECAKSACDKTKVTSTPAVTNCGSQHQHVVPQASSETFQVDETQRGRTE